MLKHLPINDVIDIPGYMHSNGKALSDNKAKSFQVFDLCCGLGGISVAASQLGMDIVAGVDLNKDALKTFKRNFPLAHIINGSIGAKKTIERCRLIINKKNSPFIIVSGPPCQGFSVAGPGNPKDRRNNVFTSVAKAIATLQPECALVENVAMLLSKKNNSRLSEFEQILIGEGYHVLQLLLDSSQFGVAQKRKRAFFFITKTLLSESSILHALERDKRLPISSQAALADLPRPDIRPESYSDEADYHGVANHLAMRHSQQVIDKISKIKPGTGPMSYRKLHPDRPSNTLFSGHRAPPAHFNEPRSITVREAARLQGFEDSFRIYGAFGNQMMQVTNAVPPPLAKAALKALIHFAKITTRI